MLAKAHTNTYTLTKASFKASQCILRNNKFKMNRQFISCWKSDGIFASFLFFVLSPSVSLSLFLCCVKRLLFLFLIRHFSLNSHSDFIDVCMVYRMFHFIFQNDTKYTPHTRNVTHKKREIGLCVGGWMDGWTLPGE